MLLAILALLALTATPSWSATYYVQKTGSNSNSCAVAQNINTPKLTISSALACLTAPGDVLRIGPGTYNESVIYTGFPVSGTAANPITITKIAGENRPLIQPLSGCYGIQINQARNYITYQDIDITGISMSGCSLTGGGSLVSAGGDDGPTGVIFRDMEWAYSPGSNIINGNQLLLEGLKIHHTGWFSNTVPGSAGSNGIYGSKIRNSIIRRVETYQNMCHGIRVWNSAAGVLSSNNIIEYNYAHDNGTGAGLDGASVCGGSGSNGGAFTIGNHNNTLRYNVGENTGGVGGRCIYLWAVSPVATSQTKIYNNTCTGHRWGYVATSGVQTSTIRNNWIFGNGNGTSDNFIDSGTGTTASNNRTTGAVTDCAPSSSTLTLKSGGSCVDAGVNVGLPYNGSAPDIGAFETFTFASCEVPASAIGTIQITFTSNAHLLGDDLTTFTATINGVSNALTGPATKVGDTIVSLPLTTTYGFGELAEFSWTSGGFSDNARIGGLLSQPFVQVLTDQLCTNNSGGAAAFAFTQAAYIFHGVFGDEDDPDIRSAENVASYSVVRGGAFRVRFALVCSGADCHPGGFYLRYATGGAYALVGDSFAAGTMAMCGDAYTGGAIPADGHPTTDQLSTAGTFVPGAVIFTSAAVPTVQLANGNKTELEYCVMASQAALGPHTFRLYKQTGDPLDAYTVTATVEVVEPRAQMVH